MTTVTFDKSRTQERFKRLAEYVQQARISPESFDCEHERLGECSATLTMDLRPLQPKNCGGLMHLGEEFDVNVDGTPLRILFVGKDYGTGNSDLTARRDCIRSLGETDLNWHYKGVVKTLLEIYQCRRDDGWQPLLARMAQTNATRCCAPRDNKMKCNTNYKTRLNCWPHFRAEIEILEPTVMIFHGADLRSPFNECLKLEGIEVRQPLSGCEHCRLIR